MPQGLTPKQEAFVRAYFEPDENGKMRSATEAYRIAYDCKNMTAKTTAEAASRLLDNSKVIAMLDDLKAVQSKKTNINVEMMIERSLKRAQAADDAGQYAAASASDQLASKLAQLLVERVDQTVRQVDPSDHKPDLANLRRKAAQTEQPAAPHTGRDADESAEKHVTH